MELAKNKSSKDLVGYRKKKKKEFVCVFDKTKAYFKGLTDLITDSPVIGIFRYLYHCLIFTG